MENSKHKCGCGSASKIPLRAQLLILLVVCALIFLFVVPATIDTLRDNIINEFEVDTAAANIKRAVASMHSLFKNEEEVLYSYSLWEDTCKAADILASGDIEYFEDWLSRQMYDFGRWSDWTCGNMLAFYGEPSESGQLPEVLWSEYHRTDPETLEMDIENAEPIPNVFKSKEFISNMAKYDSSTGLLAVDDLMLIVTCQRIVDGSEESHGFVCRAVDIRSSLATISAGAGACISVYSLLNPDVPESDREHFSKIKEFKVWEPVETNKFNGEYSVELVKEGGEWEPPSKSLHVCGPAEVGMSTITPRTLSFFRVSNMYDIKSGNDAKMSGFGLIIDNPRDLEPVTITLLRTAKIILLVFGVTVFLVYGLFTEFSVIRKVNNIAEAAYSALIDEEEDYDGYYYQKAGEKEKGKRHGKNEILFMATVAAKALEGNEKDLKKKRTMLFVEKMQSSLVADELRLLALYCDRSEEDLEALVKVDDDRKRKIIQRPMMRRDSSVFFSLAKEDPQLSITLDRVLNDPFAIEMFKNFTIFNPQTDAIVYPARRCLLFMLSVLFYRSLGGVASKETCLECLKGIVEEFFGYKGDTVSVSKANNIGEDIGVPETIRRNLLASVAKCVSSKRPNKAIFDDSYNAVRDHLNNVIYPLFAASPAFSIVKVVLSQKSVIYEQQQAVEARMKADKNEKNDQDFSLGVEQEKRVVREMNNTSDGTRLSYGALRFFTGVAELQQ